MFQLGCTQQYILTVQLLQLGVLVYCMCVCASRRLCVYVCLCVVKCVCEMYFYCTIYLCLACTLAFTVRLQLITCLCCAVSRGSHGILQLRELLCVGQSSVGLMLLWPQECYLQLLEDG